MHAYTYTFFYENKADEYSYTIIRTKNMNSEDIDSDLSDKNSVKKKLYLN